MVQCCVLGCPDRTEQGLSDVTFHRIPSQPEIREKWLRIINREKWTPHKYSSICSKHFEDECFIQRSQYRMLKRNAIPTLFVPIKLPPKRQVSSYVHRDIICTPQEITPPQQPTPEPPSANLLTITPREKKLWDKNVRLKRKFSEKNREILKLKQKTNRMKKRIITLKKAVKDVGGFPKSQSKKKKSSDNKRQHNSIQEYANIYTDKELPDINEETDETENSDDDESEIGSPVTDKVFVKSVYKEKQDGQTPPKQARLETSDILFDYSEQLYEFGKYVAEQLLCLDVEDARVAQKEITAVLWKFNTNNMMRCTTKPSTLNVPPATNKYSVVTRKVPQVNPIVSSAVQSGSKTITAKVNLPVFSVTAGPSVTQTGSQVKLNTQSRLIHRPSLTKLPALNVNSGASPRAPFGYIVVPKSTDPEINLKRHFGIKEAKLVTQPGSGTAVGSIVTQSVICDGTSVNQPESSSRIFSGTPVKTESNETQPESSSRTFSGTPVNTESVETYPESSSSIFSGTPVKTESNETQPESSSWIFSGTPVKNEFDETQSESSSIIFSETSVKTEPDELETFQVLHHVTTDT